MLPGETPLTDEQLALAFRQLWRRGWPATLEEAMRDPRYAPLIRGLARNLSRGGVARPQPAGVPRTGAPVPPTPTAPPAKVAAAGRLPRRRWASQVDAFDPRRAAANDFDED